MIDWLHGCGNVIKIQTQVNYDLFGTVAMESWFLQNQACNKKQL